MLRASVAVGLALLAGCAHRFGSAEVRSRELAVGTTRLRVVWSSRDDTAAARVVRALDVAARRVQRWGALSHPITVTIHPTHDALEGAAQRAGYAWLHAWARYDTVDVQSPRTWGQRVPDRRLEELLDRKSVV